MLFHKKQTNDRHMISLWHSLTEKTIFSFIKIILNEYIIKKSDITCTVGGKIHRPSSFFLFCLMESNVRSEMLCPCIYSPFLKNEKIHMKFWLSVQTEKHSLFSNNNTYFKDKLDNLSFSHTRLASESTSFSTTDNSIAVLVELRLLQDVFSLFVQVLDGI